MFPLSIFMHKTVKMAFGIYHTFPFDEQFIFFKHFIQNRRSWEFYSVRKKESYFKCKMIANRRNN